MKRAAPLDVELVAEALAEHVKVLVARETADLLARIALLESREPVHGKDGRDGADGKDGPNGADGKDGVHGRDGRDGLAGIQGEKGFDGKDGLHGKDGRDGIDGLGFDDLALDYDSERTFVFRFVRGDQVKEFGRIVMPLMIYRGQFRDGTACERGDTVSYAGCLWICNEATSIKPGEGHKCWSLVAKRGRDGKNGLDGIKGDPGRNGRDYTPEGLKYT